MTWVIKIHHMDAGKGDATLFNVRTVSMVPGQSFERTVLVDGGEAKNANHIIQWLDKTGVPSVDVVVVTHYDADHVNGIRAVMKTNDRRFHATRIYDQGLPFDLTQLGKLRNKRNADGTKSPTVGQLPSGDANYATYLSAIANKETSPGSGTMTTRRRITSHVLAKVGQVGDYGAAGFKAADSLVGTEILWDGLPALSIPAPKMTCIAANQYVLQPGGGTA
ncbi:MAG: MBL fold metallo-hydrolase, partial [Pseudomonadota bacterium]